MHDASVQVKTTGHDTWHLSAEDCGAKSKIGNLLCQIHSMMLNGAVLKVSRLWAEADAKPGESGKKEFIDKFSNEVNRKEAEAQVGGSADGAAGVYSMWLE